MSEETLTFSLIGITRAPNNDNPQKTADQDEIMT